MTDEELLLWLRLEDTNLTDFAADRIEELLAERNDWESHAIYNAEFVDLAVNQLAEADAKLAKAVEAGQTMDDGCDCEQCNKARAILAMIPKGEIP